ncbi:MAG TPA: nuclear transport factor 2 family protein [Candidatus Thermoplasmatota archaeon]|nr:nuclear transport factor 2 family protein [Candidatus Thermoplasmatota archaeon]
MSPPPREVLGLPIRAFNGHDLEGLEAHVAQGAPCIRDGELLGEGPAAVRRALQEEYKLSEELVGRVMELDGEPVVVEWDGEGWGRPIGVLRVAGEGRITGLRIDHDERTVARLANRGHPSKEPARGDAD